MLKKETSEIMLDTAIGPIIRIIDANSFQMQVTHIGRHNAYSYANYETVCIAPNPNLIHATQLSTALIGRRIKCKVQYRDNYNRLYGEVEFDNS